MKSISAESFRSLFDKKYMKIFTLGVFLLILGIILVMVRNLYSIFVQPSTSEEYEVYYRIFYTLVTLSGFFIELGVLLVALSTFIGGVVDDSLSPEVRRGMVFATSIAIIALALLMIFTGIYIIS